MRPSSGRGFAPERFSHVMNSVLHSIVHFIKQTNTVGKDFQPKLSTDLYGLSHMTQLNLAPFVLKSERWSRWAMQYLTMSISSFKTIYTRFDGFSTPVISFWLICTTNIFLVDLYHETLGTGGQYGVMPFSFRN